MPLRLSLCILAAALPALVRPDAASAQSAGVPIEPRQLLSQHKDLIQQAEALLGQKKLLTADRIRDLTKEPVPQVLDLPNPRTQPASGREILSMARKAFVRIGWFYLCKKCDHWHLNLAGGYAIDTKGAVATCHHCIVPPADTREAYLIAVDDQEKVYPVISVLGAEAKADTAIVQVEGGNFTPLPLQVEVAPGDNTWLYSDPLGQTGYFSTGTINRFYYKEGDGSRPDAEKTIRLNVSNDWAPGSSGAAILDQFGNAIGHVSTIANLGANAKDEPAAKSGSKPFLTLHEAATARSVKLLLSPPALPSPAAPLPGEATPPPPAPQETESVPASPF